MACPCPHHFIEKILVLLAWVAAIAYFWASWNDITVWGFEAAYHLQAAIILGILSLITGRACGCCCGMGYKHGDKGACEYCK